MRTIILTLLLAFLLAGCISKAYKAVDKNRLLAYMHNAQFSSMNFGYIEIDKGGLFYTGSDAEYHYFIILYRNGKEANRCKVNKYEININDPEKFDVTGKIMIPANEIFKPEDFDKFLIYPIFKNYTYPKEK